MKLLASRIALVTFVMFLLFNIACESDEPIEENNMPKVELDTEKPTVGIDNLPDLIEVETTFTINIIDDSEEVNTSVTINGEVLTETSEKEVVLTINPFEYPIGPFEITIVSTDKAGNETIVNKDIELRRLLIKVPATNISDVYWWEHYIIINAKDGKLVDFKKVVPYEETNMYATESFSDTEFVASLFSYPIPENPNTSYRMLSFANVPLGGSLPREDDLSNENNFVDYPAIDSEIQLTIINTENKNVGIAGYGYQTQSRNGEEYNLGLSSSIDASFIFAHEANYTSPSADLRNSYFYSILNKETDTYDFQEFRAPETFYEVAIPEELKSQSLGNFSCSVWGFKTEADYNNRVYHDIVNLSTGNINIFENGLHIPVIDVFTTYSKFIRGNIGNGYLLATRQKGLEFKPFPEMNIEQNDQEVSIMGQVDEVLFKTSSFDFSGDVFTSFSWQFYAEPESRLKIPFYTFEIPVVVEDILNQSGLNATPQSIDGTGVQVEILKIPGYTDFTNRMFQHNYYYHYREWYSLELSLGGS